MVRLLLLVFLVWAAAPVARAAPPAGLTEGGRAVVAQVIDGDTVVLDDGRRVRLVGIQAPMLPAPGRSGKPWPLAEESKAGLAALVLDARVSLLYGGARRDRHGRALAHLVLDDGTWVQERLLALGLAQVYSFADNRRAVAEMLAAETSARDAGRGVWALETYAVRDAGRPETIRPGYFEVVEGRIVEAARVRGRIYLNFGADWRTDFTVSLSTRDLPAFEEAGLAPLALGGRRVRVRGWVEDYNGPSIVIDHPEAIEILE